MVEPLPLCEPTAFGVFPLFFCMWDYIKPYANIAPMERI
jgi:hypothetical protein